MDILKGNNGDQVPLPTGQQGGTGHAFCATQLDLWGIWFEYSAFSDHEASTLWLTTTVLALFLARLLVQKLIGLLGGFLSRLLGLKTKGHLITDLEHDLSMHLSLELRFWLTVGYLDFIVFENFHRFSQHLYCRIQNYVLPLSFPLGLKVIALDFM